MKRIKLGTIGILLAISFASCKKNQINSIVPTIYPNFSKLEVGNYWIYERFDVDSSGNAIATGVIDSCFVEKDTLINKVSYFKVIRPEALGSKYSDKLVRDSLHYLVNHIGQILFSSQNFTDTFYRYYELGFLPDTICEVFVKMADKNFLIDIPAGQFKTTSFKQTFVFYPKWAEQGKLRYIDTRYAENIGIVTETLPFYSNNSNYVQRRLIRYKVK